MNMRASETFGPTGDSPTETIPPLPNELRELTQSGEGVPAAKDWSRVLDRLRISERRRRQIASLAKLNGTSFRSELLAAEFVNERDLNEALATELGVAPMDRVDAADLVIRDADCLALLGRQTGSRPAMIRGLDGDTALVVSPDRAGPSGLAKLLARAPHLRKRVRAAPAAEMRRALLDRARELLSLRAVHGLANRFPDLSARIVASFWQGLVVGVGIVSLPVGLALATSFTMAALHACFSFFFLACVSLRFAAMKDAAPLKPTPIRPVQPADLPIYSVLVALYREAEIVPELLVALGKLQWPRSKLEIKLVCEADDHQTLAAIRAHPLKPFVEIIEVPPSLPRTKPKALSYALPATSGELVVLYDAEDRPHPEQLLEAWQTFRGAGVDLACLQAPLDIANAHVGPISRMFAFEYSALFKGMLPFLARNGLLLPLGGTSNHFRRSALDHVGAWDPYNVTEDADLGMRLVRFGYRTATITRPTLEDAPTDFRTWLPQRTRWFKGWCQTWLVHMRQPRRLYAELGPASFLIAQILFLGMVISSLAHPVLLLGALYVSARLAVGATISTGQSLLLLVDVANVVCGYFSFLLLGKQTLSPGARRKFWKIVVWTPVYWMMMSIAAWRAVWQLWRNPYLWEKTPHPKSTTLLRPSAP